LQAATWVGTAQVLGEVLRFVSIIVLARLLSPDDFGVVAMAAIITSAASEIIDMGFNRAIIQRKEVTPGHLSTTFWVGCLIGIFFYGVTVACSPFVGSFFGNKLVGSILAVSSLTFVITPLGSVHGALLRKGMDFFKFSIAEAGEAVGYLIVAVSLAFAGFGVWSIVLGGLAGRCAVVSLRWVLFHWHPSLMFSFSSLKDLWSFGLNVTGIRLVDFLNKRSDYIIIGKFLTSADLGFYNLGLRMVSLPIEGLVFIVSRVAFPAFSLVQDDDERLRRGLIKSAKFLSILGFPLFTGVAIVAPELVRVVFSPKWIPAVLPMQMLCIWASANLISITVPSLILAKGRPNIYLRLTIAKVIVYVPCLLFVGVRFGTVGVALSLAVVSAIFSLAQLVFANRLISLSMRDYLVSLRPAVFASVVMALVLLAFRFAVTNLAALPDIGLLISSILLGVVVYFVTLKVTRTKALDEMVQLVLEMLRPLAKRVTAIRDVFRKGNLPAIERGDKQE
jgi:PST family polysaccharide transporter